MEVVHADLASVYRRKEALLTTLIACKRVRSVAQTGGLNTCNSGVDSLRQRKAGSLLLSAAYGSLESLRVPRICNTGRDLGKQLRSSYNSAVVDF